MSDTLAGDISLNLRLVAPIDACPDSISSKDQGPKRVSPQGVYVEAGETQNICYFKADVKGSY